ncbi:MAG: 2-amino-4-hydroxy-6-hydroxymethyldihydropteridine diphosphokinase [Bacteroidetes bacterium]|nr:2-amino-4-hydroxy-6-hydroxymethyldihydropteridine diphosphokinase [Bacteroidota bacterium]
MTKLNKAYLLTGSNMEPRFDLIKQAVAMIEVDVGKVLELSSVYESEAWGFKADKNFLNQLILVETLLSPLDLLKRILTIEKKLGRRRNMTERYQSRLIDIDILYFNNSVIDLPELTIPHPRLHVRRFAMVPLAEVAPGYVHPLLEKTNSELLASIEDSLEVNVSKEMQRDEI